MAAISSRTQLFRCINELRSLQERNSEGFIEFATLVAYSSDLNTRVNLKLSDNHILTFKLFELTPFARAYLRCWSNFWDLEPRETFKRRPNCYKKLFRWSYYPRDGQNILERIENIFLALRFFQKAFPTYFDVIITDSADRGSRFPQKTLDSARRLTDIHNLRETENIAIAETIIVAWKNDALLTPRRPFFPPTHCDGTPALIGRMPVEDEYSLS